MAVLVTRPHPDDETTAKALLARGFDVLRAPMLRFEPMLFQDDADAAYGAIIVTSANALRAHRAPSGRQPAQKLPCLRSEKIPRRRRADAGFGEVIASKGDAAACAIWCWSGEVEANEKTSRSCTLQERSRRDSPANSARTALRS